jgi:cysteine desulfurase family protein (TIGR01976 family)
MVSHDVANLGALSAPSRATSALVEESRAAMARILGATPDRIVLGPSSTALLGRLAVALEARFGPGDEIVCTDLEHDANLSPWLDLARRSGATLRLARATPDTLDLPTSAVEDVLSERTKLVAMTAASNVVGTTPDLAAAATLAHQVDALLVVDAVHAVPHGLSSVGTCGADAIVCSAYKFFGPHVSALALTPQLLGSLRPVRIRPAPAEGPESWERGALPFELLPGLVAAVSYLDELIDWAGAHAHEAALLDALLAGLADLPKVRVFGAPSARTSTVTFTVDGRTPHEVAARLAERQVAVSHGNLYAVELFKRLGLEGGVRAGLLHYNDYDDVERLLAGLELL